MSATFEDMVATINKTSSPFALASDLPVFQQGLADLANWKAATDARLQALEAAGKTAPAE